MASKKNLINFGAAMSADIDAHTTVPEGDQPNIGLLNGASLQYRSGERVQMLQQELLVESSHNSSVYDVDALDALAKDISERGIQEPLIVQQRQDGKYTIISGHRRYAAAKLAYQVYQVDTTRLPCIVRNAVKNSIEEREALILNNLQREKSDYARMMEIVTIRACAEERRAAGEDIPNIRKYICDRLGVADSELARFEKIHGALNADLLAQFQLKRLSTNVAYETSKLDAPVQAYIAENWNPEAEAPLTLPLMTRLVSAYASENSGIPASENEGNTRKKPGIKHKKLPECLQDFNERGDSLSRQLNELANNADKKTQRAVLKQANRILNEMAMLQEVLDALKAGETEG